MMVVALVVFGLLRLTPGDPAAVIAGDYATPDDVAKIRARLGLDQPLHVQLSLWFGNLLRGDLGTSIFSGLPVTLLIKQRVEPTVALAALTMIVAITIAVPLGVLAAWKQGTWIDRTVMAFAVSGFSMPVFWLGFLLVWVFAVQLGWLPVQGYSPLSRGLWAFLRQLILPALTLGFVYVALITRMTRASMLTVLREDYIRTAYAKGQTGRSVIWRHALKNAILPVVTVIGIEFAFLIGGLVVTETVFNLPGVARFLVQAILWRDYPIVQNLVMFIAVVVILSNLTVDMLYGCLDPRVKYG